ncbi:UNVERIFIED_CONTAM: hypothetical protein Sradi_5695100 [Sesamum radiatum]|uniref:Reverse transcriptase domain-containing protein n=1 Tax=Sesamum radiatum TaxID=300843 RepID=A0AAW2L2Q6_SESRA
MEVGAASLRPISTPLIGFGGCKVIPIGTIDLQILIGKEPKRKTMKFLVVDTPISYNMILRRPDLNLFKVVVSTFHLKMKFPTAREIREVRCDQKEARSDIQKQSSLVQKNSEENKRMRIERIEPTEEYKDVELIPKEPSKLTTIRSHLNSQMETLIIEFLRKNIDMFAWSPSHLKGIDPEVIVHRLNMDPQAKPVKQKKRSFGIGRNRIIEKEVNKLLKAGYVAEVQYTEWLSNVVVVPKVKKNGECARTSQT